MRSLRTTVPRGSRLPCRSSRRETTATCWTYRYRGWMRVCKRSRAASSESSGRPTRRCIGRAGVVDGSIVVSMGFRRSYCLAATGQLVVTDLRNGDLSRLNRQISVSSLGGVAATLTVDTAGTWEFDHQGTGGSDIATARELLAILEIDVKRKRPDPRAF